MTFRRFLSISLFLLASNLLVVAQQNEHKTLKKELYFLASPELKGRFPGTAEDKVTAMFLRTELQKLKLEMPFDNGLQAFNVVTSVDASPNNKLTINEKSAVYGTDFSLYAFSSNASHDGELVFAGFGMVIKTDSLKRNDYENLDVNGKWVLLLKGDPEPQNNNSVFIPFADARSKVMHAKDRGAKGVIFVSGTQNNKNDELAPLLFERAVVSSGLPVIDIKRAFLDQVLTVPGLTTDSLESRMIKGEKASVFDLKIKASATTELVRNEVTTYNIAGILTGSDPLLKNEYIIIGAHYDHLGMGGEGSGSRVPDTLAAHVGADDNASGVVTVLELARCLTNSKDRPKRSVLFVLFGAEEMGLLGSRHFAKNLPFPAANAVAMLNFDMVGRLNETKSVVVGGTGTSKETESILNELSAQSKLKLSYSPEGFGASDHASFYAENIPVMFFSTGAHSDYHTPADSPDKINYEGIAELADFAEILALNLANRERKLTFTEAGPKERNTGRRGFKVTLGIMPDFTSTSTDGLGVGGVTKGGPAERAGMKKGDKITGINGMSIGTIYDYMNRLKQLKPGQRVNVDVVRNGETIILIVDL